MIQLGNLPSTQSSLVDGQGRATPVLQLFFAAIQRAFALASTGSTTQGDIWRNRRVKVLEVNAGGAQQALGMTTVAGGTFPAPSSASYYAAQARNRIPCAAGANSQTIFQFFTQPWLWFGNAAGLGGYRYEMEFGVDTTVATTRIACGLFNAAPVITVTEPSSKTDCIFLGADSTDVNLQIMCNDSAGACSKIDLGASFPVAANACYRLELVVAPNGASVAYTVTRLDVAATATGTLSADLPANTTFLGPILGIGNAGTAAAAALGLFRILTEEPSAS